MHSSSFRLNQVFTLLLLSASLWAQAATEFKNPRQLPIMPLGFRIGLEKELLAEPLSRIIHLFDFNHLQKEMPTSIEFQEGELDHYLEASPEERLQELPKELREKLTEGLSLKDILKDIQPSRILIPGQTHSKKALSAIEIQNEQILRRIEWEKLFKRWRELPEHEKAESIRWERLNPLKKARLAIQVARFKNDQATMKLLKLKDDIPPALQELFSRLSWHQDGDALEFRYKDDIIIEDPEIFLKDLEQLSSITATTKETFHPEQTLQKSSSFHYHISIKDRDLSELSKLLNDRLFLNRVSLGIISDLTGDGNGLYSPMPFRNRGLLRNVNNDRIEFRAHDEPLLDELKLHLELLKLPEKEATDKLKSEISKLMNIETLSRIAQYDPFLLEHICSKYSEYDHQALSSIVRKLATNLIRSPNKEKEIEGIFLLLIDIKETGNLDSFNRIQKIFSEKNASSEEFNFFKTGHFKIVSNQVFLNSNMPNSVKLLKFLLQIPNFFSNYTSEIRKALEIIKSFSPEEKQKLIDKIQSGEIHQPLLERRLIETAQTGDLGKINFNPIDIKKSCINKFSTLDD